MEYNRMSTKDMIQYCDEALAWDQFGPVDIFFFESVKRILLGQCPALEEPETEEKEDLVGVIQPVSVEELMSYEEKGESSIGFRECLSDEGFFEEGSGYVLTDNNLPEAGKDEN